MFEKENSTESICLESKADGFDSVALEIIEILSKNKISIQGIDTYFKRVKEIIFMQKIPENIKHCPPRRR